jgi:hypothetical protein
LASALKSIKIGNLIKDKFLTLLIAQNFRILTNVFHKSWNFESIEIMLLIILPKNNKLKIK